jgi:hypothetical protein
MIAMDMTQKTCQRPAQVDMVSEEIDYAGQHSVAEQRWVCQAKRLTSNVWELFDQAVEG